MEIWQTISGHPSYEVSSFGRVRHAKRGIRKPDYVKGYVRYSLHIGDGRYFRDMGHAFVAKAFIGPRPENMQINHINGIKDDNRLENLEYVTPKENAYHAIHVLGKLRSKSNNSNSRVSAEGREVIHTLRFQQWSLPKLAKAFNVSESTIQAILKEKLYP